MTTLLIFCVIIAGIAVAIIIWHCMTETKLNKRKTELDQMEIRLSEKEESLESDRKLVTSLRANYREEIDRLRLRETPREVTASYTVTEADELKYTTDRAVLANAKNRIALTISHDIMKAFEPEESTTPEGRKKYTVRIFVTK